MLISYKYKLEGLDMLKGNLQTTLNFDGEERIEDDLYGLFHDVMQIKKSDTYQQYLSFIARFKKYSIFNTSLVFAQKPTVGYFATKTHWMKEFKREIKDDARPLVMLQPKGPVMFAFDIDDTEGDDNLIPERILLPFKASGKVKLKHFENLKRSLKKSHIELLWETDSTVKGGSITRTIDYINPNRPNLTINLNRTHNFETNFVTLIHEIAHLLLGHLGNYNGALWPSRINLTKNSKEFEAESVAYVLAGRLNLKTLSNEYLAGYLADNELIPPVNIHQICKTIEWIETMIQGDVPKLYKPKDNV